MLALALGILVASSGAASGAPVREQGPIQRVDVAVPERSPARFSRHDHEGVAWFSGRFQLTGTYIYGYVTDDPKAENTTGDLQLVFIPDRRERRKLPYWRLGGRVDEVLIVNSDAFVQAVIDPALVAALKRRELEALRGQITVVVEDYRVQVDCNWPTYQVAFVEPRRIAKAVAGRHRVIEYGC